jgi:hypothetical protein
MAVEEYIGLGSMEMSKTVNVDDASFNWRSCIKRIAILIKESTIYIAAVVLFVYVLLWFYPRTYISQISVVLV